MSIFSKFEDRMEDTVEGAANKMSRAPISPVQIAKKAEKQMRRGVMVGAGKQFAPTLFTVLVNPDDDARLFGYYPTLAGETETYLEAKANQEGYVMDGHPLVRFIVDDSLKHGKFDVIAETVAAPIVANLRDEEMERYGIKPRQQPEQQYRQPQQQQYQQPQPQYQQQQYQQPYAQPGYEQPAQQGYGYDAPAQVDYQGGYANDAWGNGYGGYAQPEPEYQPEPQQQKPPLPYVPEEEIDRSIDYGEYTFNSEDFEDYRDKAEQEAPMVDAYHNAPQQQMQQAQQMQQPNTAVFTAGANGAAGAAAAPNHRAVRARLVDRAYQRSYDLAGTRVTLGRSSDNDIVVQDINASRKHAELRLNAQGIWVVTDLRSMNGTLVNGISVASQPLYPGDTVTIGKTDYDFLV